ncbi:hypothetical protein FACS18949_02440 [Clostridia bacterium]|nr:hypothetical protein FACS18949_02440 [Clostridia bacterium]
MTKRLLAMLTALLLAVTLAPLSALAAAFVPAPLPEVRNQGADDVSYAFAVTAAAELALARGGFGNVDLSENFIRFAMSAGGGNALGFTPSHSQALNAYDNRAAIAAFLERGKMGGLALEEHSPYIAGVSSAPSYLTTEATLRSYRIGDVIYLPNDAPHSVHIDDVKAAIDAYGAAVGWIYSPQTTTTAKTDVSAVWSADMKDLAVISGNYPVNWAVAAVGYDDGHEAVINGKAYTGAFLIKNSWGTDAQDGGYFWLCYDDIHALANAFALANPQSLSTPPADKIYENDTFGASAPSLPFGGDAAFAANMFTVTSTQTSLAVSFAVLQDNTDYEVYLKSAASGTSLELGGPADYTAPAAAGSKLRAGYYTVDLGGAGDELYEGDTVAVIVKYTHAGGVTVPAGKSATSAKSFVYNSADGVWQNVATYGSSACIKLLVTENKPRPTQISFLVPELTLKVKDAGIGTGSFYAEVSAEDGADKSLVWSSSDKTVATVGAGGVVTAVGAGGCYITATAVAGGVAPKSGKVTVLPTTVDGVRLNLASTTMKAKTTVKLTATVTPSHATHKDITWSIPEEDWEYATVSSLGSVKALKPTAAGRVVTVTASTPTVDGIEGKTASCDVTITADYVKSFKFSGATKTLSVGSVVPIAVTFTPSSSYNTTLGWALAEGYENGGEVAEIDEETRMITAKKAGTVVYVATPTEEEPSLTVPNPSMKLTIVVTEDADYYLNLGKYVTFNTAIAGTSANFQWRIYKLGTAEGETDPDMPAEEMLKLDSSNEMGIVLNAARTKAKLTGTAIGKFRIIIWEQPAEDNDDPDGFIKKHLQAVNVYVKKAVTKVTVAMSGDPQGDTAKRLKKYELTVNEDGSAPASLHLNYSVTPVDATFQNVTWTTSKASIATVDADGNVTAVGPGTATITCKSVSDTGKKATFRVAVKYNTRGVTLVQPKTTQSEVKKTIRLKAQIERFKNVATALEWSSSDESVATVSKGAVKFVGVGKATITVKSAGGHTASIEVEGYVKVKSVAALARLELKPNDTYTLEPVITPADATYPGLTYVSKDDSVASVSANGVITARGVGSTSVVITAVGGAKRSVLIKVK